MADLFVHYSIGHTGGKFLHDKRIRVIFYVGNFLPDIVFKTFCYFTNSPTWYCEPSHSPLVLLVICYSITLLFQEELRKNVFWALVIGSYLHIIIDSFKSYMGSGVILWIFPFSMNRIEFGWYHPDETIYLIIPAVVLIAIAEFLGFILKRNSAVPN